ncbi:MAG: ParB/RepB/Spo0J family partition protein [Anaerolineales bacterium]|jgi:ParB family chromosome partitioning protein|nr:ParB/RepB/Spo0J family partition protein [Anaerolineales bacterium]
MPPKKPGLGKGLEALIPVGETGEKALPVSGVSEILIDDITPNPRQPRTHFDFEELEELAASIREHGIIQPLILTHGDLPGTYTLIAGERRWQAAKQAGLDRVPAIIREATEQERLELALIENIQRTDLSPLESAEAYRHLADDFGLSQDAIAQRVGKSRVAVSNTMRLLKLPEKVRQTLAEGRITEGHARALLGLSTHQAQVAALHTVLKNNLTVRQTEELVRKLTGQKPDRAAKPALPAEIKELEEQLRAQLGTRVSLNHKRKGGTLVIHYYSDEELNALAEKLLGES